MSDHAPSPRIAVTIDGAVARIALDRPRERNPLDWRTIRELLEAVAAIEAEAAVRVVVVSGNGGHFSSGGDLKARRTLKADEFHRRGFPRSAQPDRAVGSLSPWCRTRGGWAGTAARLRSPGASARIGDAHVNFGQLPGAGGRGACRGHRPVRAKYLMLTGDIIAAAEAERLGLLSAVVADERLEV